MPVPLPDPTTEDRLPPDLTAVKDMSRGILGVVAPDGGLTELQRILIQAVVSAMTGFAPDLDAEPVSPEEFAVMMARRDTRRSGPGSSRWSSSTSWSSSRSPSRSWTGWTGSPAESGGRTRG